MSRLEVSMDNELGAARASVASAVGEIGTLDMLVNDAGFTWTAPSTTSTVSRGDLVMDTNVPRPSPLLWQP